MNDIDGASAPQNLNDAQLLIKKAMEDVKQELLIIDKSGKSHLVYIFDAHIHDGKLHVDYKAVNENDEIHQLVHEAMNAQIKQIMKEQEAQNWLKQSLKIFSSTIRTLFRRIRT